MTTNLQWTKLETLVDTPKQHENISRKSKDGLYLRSINSRDLPTHDD